MHRVPKIASCCVIFAKKKSIDGATSELRTLN